MLNVRICVYICTQDRTKVINLRQKCNEMNTKIFTKEELTLIKVSSIATKHGCTSSYARRVLEGQVARNTSLTCKITIDAIDILDVLKRDTKVTI